MLRFRELSNFLFSGAFDFMSIWVRTLRAHESTPLFSFTRISSFKLVYNTLSKLSRKAASLLKTVAPFYSLTCARYFVQSESPQFYFLGEMSLLR